MLPAHQIAPWRRLLLKPVLPGRLARQADCCVCCLASKLSHPLPPPCPHAKVGWPTEAVDMFAAAGYLTTCAGDGCGLFRKVFCCLWTSERCDFAEFHNRGCACCKPSAAAPKRAETGLTGSMVPKAPDRFENVRSPAACPQLRLLGFRPSSIWNKETISCVYLSGTPLPLHTPSWRLTPVLPGTPLFGAFGRGCHL